MSFISFVTQPFEQALSFEGNILNGNLIAFIILQMLIILAGCAYTFIILLWLGFLALVVGKMLFGSGDLMVLNSDGLIVLQEKDLAWRFLSGFSMAYLSLVMIATLSLTLSCFSENSIGPIVSTMAIIIIFTIIGALDVPVLQKVQPFLFTTHMVTWRNFFEDPLPVGKIVTSASILLVHIVALLSIAVYKFNRKDILS